MKEKWPNRLKELREAKGWRQQDVADRLGMTARGVSLHEQGINFNGHRIDAYARLYGVTPRELFVAPSEVQPALVTN